MAEGEPKIEGNNIEDGIKGNMEILKEQGIIALDVGLTEEERKSMQEVKIEKEIPDFDYYGPVSDELIKKLSTHLGGIAENSEGIKDTIARFVAKVAESTIKGFNQESAWIAVRFSLPNNEYEVPRWHRDGAYFKPFDGETYKLVMTLKGAQTRFAGTINEERFNQLDLETAKNNSLVRENEEKFKKEDIRLRKELDLVVKEIEPCKEGQAAVFLGQRNHGKIHSEPHILEPRIFMSVIPASREQIDELRKRWEDKET